MLKKFNKALIIILLVVIICSLTGCKPKLDEMATACVILQISDIHIKNDEAKDSKAYESIRGMIESVNPDLIVLTGDLTSEIDNMTAFQSFGTFIEAFEIPWAFTYGNHDGEGTATKQQLNDYLLSLEYCIYERGDESVDGYGNYYQNVNNELGEAIISLIMMDSNMYGSNDSVSGYDKFHENQIEWYENTIKAIANDVNGDEADVLPSLAFFQIPMTEYTAAYNIAKDSDTIIYGQRGEAECSPYEDDLMFEKMVQLGSTKGVFVGHDHMNDYSVMYEGIRLTYANSCDHNIFFVIRKGGTIINIKNNGSFTQQRIYKQIGGTEFIIDEET